MLLAYLAIFLSQALPFYFMYTTGKSSVHTKWESILLNGALGVHILVCMMGACQESTKRQEQDIKTAVDAHAVFQPHSWELIQTGFLSRAEHLSIEQQMCHVREIQMALDIKAPWMTVLVLLAAACWLLFTPSIMGGPSIWQLYRRGYPVECLDDVFSWLCWMWPHRFDMGPDSPCKTWKACLIADGIPIDL